MPRLGWWMEGLPAPFPYLIINQRQLAKVAPVPLHTIKRSHSNRSMLQLEQGHMKSDDGDRMLYVARIGDRRTWARHFSVGTGLWPAVQCLQAGHMIKRLNRTLNFSWCYPSVQHSRDAKKISCLHWVHEKFTPIHMVIEDSSSHTTST